MHELANTAVHTLMYHRLHNLAICQKRKIYKHIFECQLNYISLF